MLHEERVPNRAELDKALAESVRGKATVDTPIEWDGLCESFTVLVGERMQRGSLEDVKEMILSFSRTISERLDYAVERAH